jgi:hypothetical protein
MSAFGLRDLVLAGLMGVGGMAGAQENAADLKAVLIASPASGKTVELMDGRVVTYRQLVELPVHEREAALELAKKPSMRSNFQSWEGAIAIAKAEADSKAEIAKVEADSKAEIAEAQKRLDVALAQKAEKEKSGAAVFAEFAGNIEGLANTIHQAIVLKIQLARSYRTTLENALNIEGVADRLKPETLSFLKSVLARPELFKDK